MNVCPRFRAANIASGKERYEWEDEVCLGNDCEWWIERFGRCCIAVNTYLAGEADQVSFRGCKAEARAEAKSERDRSGL